MNVILATAAAMGAMFLKDSINTLLVIMEARGRAAIAGHLAAASDFAGMLVTVTSAGLVIQHGWTVEVLVVVVAMMITSDLGTRFWTRVGQRIAQPGEQGLQADHAAAQVPELARRLAAVEARLGE